MHTLLLVRIAVPQIQSQVLERDGQRFSLSQRERAGVREKRANDEAYRC